MLTDSHHPPATTRSPGRRQPNGRRAAPADVHPAPTLSGCPLVRREFCRRGLGLALAGGALPALLAACGEEQAAQRRQSPAAPDRPPAGGRPIVGDVKDFALHSEEWAGAFGFVTLALHRAVFDGEDVYFIRTDTSDLPFARKERLVWAPKLGNLLGDALTGSLYVVDGGTARQAAVMSSEPGRRDYTPAWRVHRVRWRAAPETLSTVADVEAAERAGKISVERTDIVLNAPIVKWSSGELAVDTDLNAYLGSGQLVEPPDIEAMTVTFKLHECFPGARYIVTDHSIAPAAEMTHTAYAPRLQNGPRDAGATGRTNVFMNGLKGPGPMGFQPSVFDSDPGDPAWSPYWDHFAYAWRRGERPRVLRDERSVHAARDAGELKEIPGVPDTKGAVFTVNCPVPVVALAAFGRR